MLIVDISTDADEDIERLFNYIAYEVMNDDAAFAYRTGIVETIAKLSYMGEVIAFSKQPYILKRFGAFARTTTYKKMTIVYETINGVAYIHRVIPSKLIH